MQPVVGYCTCIFVLRERFVYPGIAVKRKNRLSVVTSPRD